jgi:hypothetical protein
VQQWVCCRDPNPCLSCTLDAAYRVVPIVSLVVSAMVLIDFSALQVARHPLLVLRCAAWYVAATDVGSFVYRAAVRLLQGFTSMIIVHAMMQHMQLQERHCMP